MIGSQQSPNKQTSKQTNKPPAVKGQEELQQLEEGDGQPAEHKDSKLQKKIQLIKGRQLKSRSGQLSKVQVMPGQLKSMK